MSRHQDELVTYQLENDEPVHVAMSLCDLAFEAKSLGVTSLQLGLTERAIDIRPNDAWAWAQYADALLQGGKLSDSLQAYEQAAAFGAGVVAKTGRAETLKALGKLTDALTAYDAIIIEYPEEVVAKNGHAETLKSLGRLDDALAAYNIIIANNPENVTVKNGLSGVLVALHRYDEALQFLPSESPSTLSEWIGYHIRGMILLRTGKIDEAIKIFVEGVRDNPQPASKEYFRTALVVARLRRREFIEAGRILDEVTTPVLQPQANVLRLHSFGASGERERAATAYQALADKPWSVSDELVAELHRKYILKEEPQHDDEWVFEQEVNTLLLVANQQAMMFGSMTV